MTYWVCPREWPDETAWIVCGGPSLKGFDFSALVGRRTIAINSSIFAGPRFGFGFFGDRRWFAEYRSRVLATTIRLVTNSPTVRDPRVFEMKKVKPPPGIIDDRDTLPMLWTSTAPAMQLAVHLGARRIVLLGLDGKNGGSHHHDEYKYFPPPSDKWQSMQFESLGYCVEPLQKRGIEVVNANPDSAVPYWPKRPLETCLREYP